MSQTARHLFTAIALLVVSAPCVYAKNPIFSYGWGGPPCRTFDPATIYSPSLLIPWRNPSHADDGALSWPNQTLFLKRNRSHPDDMTTYYPDTSLFVLRNRSHRDDGTVYWPNGQIFLYQNPSHADDETVYHSNGDVWLLRNRGHRDDRRRFGPAVEELHFQDFDVDARIGENDSPVIRVVMQGRSWELRVSALGTAPTLNVEECY